MNRLAKSLAIAAVALTAAFPALAKTDALSLVPANAVTVGVVNVSDMRTSPLSGMLFDHADRMGGNGEASKFLTEAGLDPKKDIDVLVVATAPRTNLGKEADVLVAAEGRYNVERLTSALVTRGAIKKAGYYLLPEEAKTDNGERGAVAFPDSKLALMGTERAVAGALAAYANGGTGFRTTGALAPELGRIDAKATAWAIVDVTRAQRLAGARVPHAKQGNDALNAALKSVSTMAVWATDTGDAMNLGAFGLANDEETLMLLEDTLRGALSAMRLAVKDKAPELVSLLRRFEISRTDTSVSIRGSVPASTIRDVMKHKSASK
ncbi:MAG TPA: hypothetical protein VF618_07775 [Thermoanaerobaculia bacterium]